VQSVFVDPLKIMIEQLKLLLQAQPVSLKTLPPDLVRSWQTQAASPASKRCLKATPTTTTRCASFAAAVLAAEPTAIGGPVSILKSARPS